MKDRRKERKKVDGEGEGMFPHSFLLHFFYGVGIEQMTFLAYERQILYT